MAAIQTTPMSIDRVAVKLAMYPVCATPCVAYHPTRFECAELP